MQLGALPSLLWDSNNSVLPARLPFRLSAYPHTRLPACLLACLPSANDEDIPTIWTAGNAVQDAKM